MMDRRFFLWGAFLALLGVALGALGTHWLEARLPAWYEDSPRRLEAWRSAVFWQVVHALALMIVALLPAVSGRGCASAGWLFVAGVGLFSGFIYAWVLLGVPTLVAPVPVGGLILMAGWGALIYSVARSPRSHQI